MTTANGVPRNWSNWVVKAFSVTACVSSTSLYLIYLRSVYFWHLFELHFEGILTRIELAFMVLDSLEFALQVVMTLVWLYFEMKRVEIFFVSFCNVSCNLSRDKIMTQFPRSIALYELNLSRLFVLTLSKLKEILTESMKIKTCIRKGRYLLNCQV